MKGICAPSEAVLKYFTNRVSGSVPSVATAFTTLAVTPEVPPVNVVSIYVVISLTDLDVNLMA